MTISRVAKRLMSFWINFPRSREGRLWERLSCLRSRYSLIMRLLLDECLARNLKRDLVGHEVMTVVEAGYSGMKNGALLRAASDNFDVLITVDRNLPFQQNIGSFQIAVLILMAQ